MAPSLGAGRGTGRQICPPGKQGIVFDRAHLIDSIPFVSGGPIRALAKLEKAHTLSDSYGLDWICLQQALPCSDELFYEAIGVRIRVGALNLHPDPRPVDGDSRKLDKIRGNTPV